LVEWNREWIPGTAFKQVFDESCRKLRLETINLSRNPLTSIPSSTTAPSSFRNLHSLVIQQCSLKSYLSLENLNSWLGASLTNLRMSLGDMPREGSLAFGEREDRALVIACLEGLEELNGSTVSGVWVVDTLWSR
jgi:hypothetical protein